MAASPPEMMPLRTREVHYFSKVMQQRVESRLLGCTETREEATAIVPMFQRLLNGFVEWAPRHTSLEIRKGFRLETSSTPMMYGPGLSCGSGLAVGIFSPGGNAVRVV